MPLEKKQTNVATANLAKVTKCQNNMPFPNARLCLAEGGTAQFLGNHIEKKFVNLTVLVIEAKWLFCCPQCPQAQCIISPGREEMSANSHYPL